MNEQIKKAWEAIKEYWAKLSPKVKRTIITVAVVIVVVALGLTLYWNLSGSTMVVLYTGLEASESQEIYNVLQEQGFVSRINSAGLVEVRRQDQDRAIGQLAMLNYPKSAMVYDYFTENNGLTTTDTERRQLIVQQLQNRLQTTIQNFDGVKTAVVTLDIPQTNAFPWGGQTQTATGSVSLVLESGYTPTRDQVSGIKYLVAKSVGSGMQPSDVAVIDAATWVNLKSRDDDNSYDDSTERLALEEQIEQSLVDKARNVLSIAYNPEDMRISATVTLDYNKVITESKQYMASDESNNNTGVVEHHDSQYVVNGTDVAEGLVGEENNTDVPTYGDQNGDGVTDMTNYATNTDYAVPYVLQQIEKDNAELVSATMSVMLNGTLGADSRRSLIESISMATGISQENISVQSVDLGSTPQTQTPSRQIDTTLLILIGAGVVLFLILILILVLVTRNRKKNRLEKERAARLAREEEEARRQEQEIEEHKHQLQQLAKANSKEDAITGEIREFAQENPEITASLLRAWLKEGEE